MLGLILTNEEAYEMIKSQMCDALPPDRKQQMVAAFEKLMFSPLSASTPIPQPSP
jgi:hypothetical protein